jgi:hypothetical protein
VPVSVIASVLVLQTLQDLSDSEAMQALRCDLRWKVACGLPVDHAGFHPTTLTVWRNRLRASARPDRIFAAVREVIRQSGVLNGKTRRAVDSVVFDDAVATQDTVTQLIAAIRRVRREVPGAADLIAQCHAHDWDDPGKPRIAWDDKTARDAVVSALVVDALTVVDALSGADLSEPAAQAVALLALVAGQDVEPAEGSDGTDGRWRIARRVAEDRVISVVDPQARHVHKTVHHRQDGFKGHVSIEPDTGLFTAGRLAQASGEDNHEAVIGRALLDDDPAHDDGEQAFEVLGDTAYGTGEARAGLAQQGHTAIIKPGPLRPAVAGGYTIDDFTVNAAAGTVTCPNGVTRRITAARNVVFGVACRSCPLRGRCTTANHGRSLSIHPHHTLLRQARHAWATDEDLRATYRQHRPMVERSIAWLIGPKGRCRQLRYHGVDANNWWLHTRMAALNLRRLLNLGLQHDNGAWILNPTTA